jgi:hypothetical protein
MRSVNPPQLMKKALIDIVCESYESTARNTALVEKITAASGRVFSLRMQFPNGQARFELHVDATQPTHSTEPPVVVPNPVMTSAVIKGQPFIRFLLATLNATALLSEVAAGELSVDSPTSMGGAIHSEWGSIFLMFPQGAAEYSLNVRITARGEPRVKQSYFINPDVVAQAVQAGETPLFAALRSCPAAAELLAQHDQALQKAIEAETLREASTSPRTLAPSVKGRRSL